jgi:ribosomal-protein-alanine N-acetyltransferase
MDYRDFFTFLADPEVCKYMVFDTLNEEQSKNYVKKFLDFQKEEPRKYIKFAVVLKKNKEVIGECGIISLNDNHKHGELIYRYSKKYWGYGYATETSKEIIRFGFDVLGLHRIDASCDIRNEASAKVLSKIGMSKEGCLREHKLIKGEWRSSYIYSILENEWKYSSDI